MVVGIRNIKGIDTMVLEEDGRGGYISIDVPNLTAKVEDVFPEATLLDMEASNYYPPALRNMTFVALIKYDAARNNKMGWTKHGDAMRAEGFDV